MTCAVLAMILILLSSRVRTSILSKALPFVQGPLLDLDRLLDAYRLATVASFFLLRSNDGPIIICVAQNQGLCKN